MQARLAALPFFGAARVVGLYAAQRFELGLDGVAQGLLQRGVTVAFPRVMGDTLCFVAVPGLEVLQLGPFGVRTPPDGPAVAPEVVCVPGVAFTRKGDRLGRGGGYYDRFLSASPALRIGITFEATLVESLPVEPHDAPMDWVVTESSVFGPLR